MVLSSSWGVQQTSGLVRCRFFKFGHPRLQSSAATNFDSATTNFDLFKSDLAAKRHDENGSKLHHECEIMSFQRG